MRLATVLDNPTKGSQIVGGCERGGILEVNFILPRSLLMMRTLGLNAHFLERQANLTAHVLGAVEGAMSQ